jgi:tRNA U38,U39,U40 pseudouridine synthase TruA
VNVIRELLAEDDNSNVSQPAPPHALFLERVDYPSELYMRAE